MILTNYWWLLIWVFIGGWVLNIYIPKRHEVVLGNTEVRWRVLPAFLLMLPYIVWAGFRSNAFGDSPLSSMGQKNMRGEWH